MIGDYHINLPQKFIRKLYPHGAVRHVLRGYLRGYRFEVVTGMGLTYALGFNHLNFRFLAARLRPGDTVYDVGANCGQMSLFFAERTTPGGWVLAFEPMSENVARLRRNLVLNEVTSVRVFEAAVAEDDHPRCFNFDPDQHSIGGLSESRAHGTHFAEQRQVPCVFLDGLLDKGESPPDLMKVDVEGGGLGVIRGAAKLLSQHRPKIFFEIHAPELDSLELAALRLLKREYGYRWFDMEGEEIHELTPLWGAPVWCEVI